jgi:hypothetical protein
MIIITIYWNYSENVKTTMRKSVIFFQETIFIMIYSWQYPANDPCPFCPDFIIFEEQLM